MEVISKADAAQKAVSKIMEITEKYPLDAGRSGTGADNAKFGTVNIRGAVSFHQYPCHVQLRESTNKDAVVVYSTWGKRPVSDINYTALRSFFDWIRSDTGPWKAFEGRNVSHVPEGWTRTVDEFIWDYGRVWSDVDKYPSNLQHSFLTASRMAPEWPQLINKWHDWVNMGADKALAFVFLDLFRPHEGNPKYPSWGYTDQSAQGDVKIDLGQWQLNRSNRYDWPLDTCTGTEQYVRNFINGRVEALNKPFAEDNRYRPVNRIFGMNKLDCMDKDAYPSVLFKLYSSKYGPGPEGCNEIVKSKASLTQSEFSYERHWFISESEVLAIIKEESERLYAPEVPKSNSDLSKAKGISSSLRNRVRDGKGRFLKAS